MSNKQESSAADARRVFEFAQVDVFAERALEGNMLAVFADGRGLGGREMQAIARETNLSETAFIVPRDAATEAERGVRVRIFTTREELPFAGHPTLGTASWLWWNHVSLRGAPEIRLDLNVGPIPVRFTSPEARGEGAAASEGVFAEMRQRDPEFLMEHDRREAAEAMGLGIEDLSDELPVQTVSTGMAYCVVPLRSLEVAARLAIPKERSEKYLAARGARFFYSIVPAQAGSGADWHARMQFYGTEDPATGSAAGCAISYLVRHGAVASEQRIVIQQGIEISRPSRIHAHAKMEGGRVFDAHVGGRTIHVASGSYFLPRAD